MQKRCGGLAFYIPHTTSETTVVATRCEFANSDSGATVNGILSSAKFNNCLFYSNRRRGIHAWNSTIHLHGEATSVHSNEEN